MANERLVNVLSDCIDRLAAGQQVEDCLRAYPQYADQLAPMLEAGRIGVRARPAADEIARAQDRVRFHFEQALQTPTPRRSFPLQRLASLAAVLVLVFGLALGGTVIAAQSSLPGDALYGVKRWSEDVRLVLSGDSEPLKAGFARRRVDEIHELFSLGREAEVDFAGIVTAITTNNMTVAGLPVQIDALTPGASSLQAGAQVKVRAMTTSGGELIALEIQPMEQSGQPVLPTDTPTPTMTYTPTAAATNTPTSTMTYTPSPTPTAAPTSTPLIAVTNTPSPTREPSQMPTVAASLTEASREQTEQSACAASQPPGWVTYRVQSGDTLSGLAVGSGVPLDEMMRANCIEYPGLIVVGQPLYLPRTPILMTPTGRTGEGGSTPAISTPSGEGDGGSGGGDSGGSGENGDGDDHGEGNDDGAHGNDDSQGGGPG